MIYKNQNVCVSRKAIQEGHIGFAYRTNKNSGDDTGFRLMYDKNESAIDLANPDKVYICKIKKFLVYFPEVEEMLHGKTGSVWEEQDGKLVQIARVKEFTEDVVPHLMVGNVKFTSSMGVGIIVSSDPKNFLPRGLGTEEWEKMLPPERQKLAEK